MKRRFSYRPMLFCAIYFCLGLLSAYFNYSHKLPELAISLVLLCSLPIIIVFWRKHIRLMAILMCFAVLGFSLFNIAVDTFKRGQIDATECRIVGTVTKSVVEKDYGLKFYMRDCQVYLPNGKNKNLEGIVSVTCKVGAEELSQEIKLGTYISFDTTILPTDILDKNKDVNSFNYKMNIKHNCMLTSTEGLVISTSEATIAEQINMYVLDMLLNNMSQENAYLAWSVLFGDSTQLDENVVEAFKISGVMHIIAVSGMNVVFIVAIIMGFLKLIGVRNKYAKFFTLIGVLLFYSWLCSFTPSVVRASIMALVFLYAKIMGRRGDMWSNIGFSAILILSLQPLMLFEPGFLLSFGSLIGIILVNDVLENFFRNKLHIPKYIAVSLSVTISAQLGIYPIMALFFGDFSTYSFLANIIIVPVFEMAYLILFVLVIVATIIPATAVFLAVPELAFSFINWFPTLFPGLPYAYLDVFTMGMFSGLFMLLLVFMSQYVFISKKWRAITCIALSVIVGASIGFGYVVKNHAFITPVASSYIIRETKNDAKIMINASDPDSTKEILVEYKIFTIDYFVFWTVSEDGGIDRAYLKELSKMYKPKMIFLSNAHIDNWAFTDWLDNHHIKYKNINDTVSYYKDFSLKTFGDSEPYALLLGTNDYNYLFVPETLTNENLITISNYALSSDISRAHILYGQTLYPNAKMTFNSLEQVNSGRAQPSENPNLR